MMKRTVLGVAMALLLGSCAQKKEAETYEHSVYVTVPQSTGSGETRVYAGVVEEAHTVSLGFKTPGQIKRIFVKEGDYVKEGQAVAELDDADYKLGVEALQIQYDQVADEVARARKLFEKKSMSANDYEKASAGLRQLGVQLEVNKNKLAYTRLYAPASGYIQRVNFSAGEMVDAGTAVMSLLDVSGMEVAVDVPAAVYGRRNDFSGIWCRPSHGEADGDSIALRFVSLVPKADNNQLYRMRLGVADGDKGKLTSGMNVEVSIKMNGTQGGESARVELPMSAIWRDADGQSCVWVVAADSTVVKRAVTLDESRAGRNATVTSGVGTDDKVVRAGVNSLQAGEKVNVIAAPAVTNAGGLL